MTTVSLPYPPSVNHLFSVVRGRPVLTKEVRAFRQQVRTCVRDCHAMVGLGPLAVRLELHPPDHRRRDCDNAQKPILDALQQAGLYFDDAQIVWLLTVKLAPAPGGRVVARLHALDEGPLPPGLACLDLMEQQH